LRTSDGKFIAVHLSSKESFWHNLVSCVGIANLGEDPDFATYRLRVQNWEKLELVLATRFREQTSRIWEATLEAGDVPFSPQLSIREAAAHPQITHLDLFEQKGDWRAVFRGPWRVNGVRPHVSVEAPSLGSSTAAVLAEILDRTDIERLRKDGIIAEA
jgi:crotonobetainyl-CoA:carnitine CoA-transferase CaiB-like acyl-CoA transferase